MNEDFLRTLCFLPFFISVGVALSIFHYKLIPDMHRLGIRHPKGKDPMFTMFGQYYYWNCAEQYRRECTKRGESTKYYTAVKYMFIPIILSFFLACATFVWWPPQQRISSQPAVPVYGGEPGGLGNE
jgi:hypothetical protein